MHARQSGEVSARAIALFTIFGIAAMLRISEKVPPFQRPEAKDRVTDVQGN
jgi:hypothetical protein